MNYLHSCDKTNASTVWVQYHQYNIKALEQVQRRAAHYVFSDHTSRTPGCVTKISEGNHLKSGKDITDCQCYIEYSTACMVDILTEKYLLIGDGRTRVQYKFLQEKVLDDR